MDSISGVAELGLDDLREVFVVAFEAGVAAPVALSSSPLVFLVELFFGSFEGSTTHRGM